MTHNYMYLCICMYLIHSNARLSPMSQQASQFKKWYVSSIFVLQCILVVPTKIYKIHHRLQKMKQNFHQSISYRELEIIHISSDSNASGSPLRPRFFSFTVTLARNPFVPKVFFFFVSACAEWDANLFSVGFYRSSFQNRTDLSFPQETNAASVGECSSQQGAPIWLEGHFATFSAVIASHITICNPNWLTLHCVQQISKWLTNIKLLTREHEVTPHC